MKNDSLWKMTSDFLTSIPCIACLASDSPLNHIDYQTRLDSHSMTDTYSFKLHHKKHPLSAKHFQVFVPV